MLAYAFCMRSSLYIVWPMSRYKITILLSIGPQCLVKSRICPKLWPLCVLCYLYWNWFTRGCVAFCVVRKAECPFAAAVCSHLFVCEQRISVKGGLTVNTQQLIIWSSKRAARDMEGWNIERCSTLDDATQVWSCEIYNSSHSSLKRNRWDVSLQTHAHSRWQKR